MTLTIENIHKSFGAKQVLKGISLEATPGSPFALLGRNGAGKTTLIRIIMGVFGSDEGRVLLDGQPIDRRKLSMGYLPEERGLYPKKIILDQLVYLAALKGLSRDKAIPRIDDLLTRMDMFAYRGKRLDTLSKGNQQKIQLVATLVVDPDILVLDEPFSGFDPVNAALFEDIIREETQRGKIIFLSSHQMNYIEEFCDDLAILRDGQIALSGRLRELRRSYPRDRIVLSSRQADAIAPFCLKLPYVTDVAAEEHRVTITLSRADDKSALLTALIGQEFDLDEVAVFEPSLHDIFVDYTTAAAGAEVTRS